MFDEMRSLTSQKLTGADPADVAEALRQEVNAMPPHEVALHIKTATENIEASGNTDLAKELADLALAANQEPDALKRALITFTEAHPAGVMQFAPQLAERIFARL